MSRRFRPPPLAGFYIEPGSEHATALHEARGRAFADGRADGLLEGHATGFAEGQAKTRAELQAELDTLHETLAKCEKRETIGNAMERLLAVRDVDLATLESTVRDVAVIALRTIFPVLLSRAAGAEIAALLAGALTDRVPEVLTLRAHPETIAAVADMALADGALADGVITENHRVILTGDPRLGFGAAEIGWTGGGLTFDPASLLSRITSVLTPSPRAELLPPAQGHPPPREDAPDPGPTDVSIAGQPPDPAIPHQPTEPSQ
jgi:flagellar biosynthesis/type III secretory pathway protein FliH